MKMVKVHKSHDGALIYLNPLNILYAEETEAKDTDYALVGYCSGGDSLYEQETQESLEDVVKLIDKAMELDI